MKDKVNAKRSGWTSVVTNKLIEEMTGKIWKKNGVSKLRNCQTFTYASLNELTS